MSFDWQTEETTHWEKLPGTPEPEKEPKSRRWLLFLLLLLALLLFGGTVGGYWALSQRVEQGTENAESDLLASHVLVAEAAEEADVELMTTFLSGRDKEWALTLEQLVADGRYQNREPFGLTWLPVDAATAVISTTVNPQFNSAEVVSEQEYGYSIGNRLTDTVKLQQTAIYRLGPDRWLLAPPDEPFWGESLTKEGFYISLTFPERDQEMAERLALDLDTAVAAVCAHPAFECPEEFHMQVEFSTDPASLSPEYNSVAHIDQGWLFRLPTPTLVGIPQDEAGYQVLARGYGAQLVTAVMLRLFGFAASAEGPFLQAWLAWQLDRLALRPYPLTTADWQALAEDNAVLGMGEPLWNSSAAPTPVPTPFAYALIDFFVQELQVPPPTIINVMNDSLSYEEWLLEVVDGRYSIDELDDRWQAYLRASAEIQ